MNYTINEMCKYMESKLSQHHTPLKYYTMVYVSRLIQNRIEIVVQYTGFLNINNCVIDDEYSFVYTEYDGNIVVDEDFDKKAYNNLLNRYKPKFKKFKADAKLNATINNNYSIVAPEMNRIDAEHEALIVFSIPYRRIYTSQQVIGATKVLLNSISWE